MCSMGRYMFSGWVCVQWVGVCVHWVGKCSVGGYMFNGWVCVH